MLGFKLSFVAFELWVKEEKKSKRKTIKIKRNVLFLRNLKKYTKTQLETFFKKKIEKWSQEERQI